MAAWTGATVTYMTHPDPPPDPAPTPAPLPVPATIKATITGNVMNLDVNGFVHIKNSTDHILIPKERIVRISGNNTGSSAVAIPPTP